ncbi:restriction endonuclease subunit S [uncultured Xanthomonas sp.]|uniref:restriction endonuclease subunit S n=1 Tax=uncultured Xanthomonas sp. TaxID=152831 RepID=UPI0025E60520|nr:restriction endonuclease subunit S [uncultured Xanthomonas sp.]
MLPKQWTYTTVADACETVSVGIVVNPSSYYVDASQGVRAFRSGNVRENKINDSNWVYLSEEGQRKNKKSILHAGDVLVVRTGFAGTACVVSAAYEGANCIDVLFARPNLEKLLPEYLCQLTNSELGRKQVLAGQSGLAQKHLNVSSYEKMGFGLPPVWEQRRIAHILSTWDQAIATAERLLANSQHQKLALMLELLSPKKNSGGWSSYRLGDLFSERVEGKQDDLPLLSITRDDGIVLRDSVGRKDTSNEDKSKYLRICPGDIGYNTMRMWQGVSALSTLEGIVSPAYTVIVPNEKIDARFAAYLFKLEKMVFTFYRHSQGLVSDTWSLKFDHFKKIRVQIPARAEQERIVGVLAAADEVISAQKAQARNLRSEKSALMSQLLTGKRRVRLPADETDSA